MLSLLEVSVISGNFGSSEAMRAAASFVAGVRWFAAARASAAQREARAAKAANLRSGRPHCRLRCPRAGSASSGAYDVTSAKASNRLRLTASSSGRRPASFAVWPPPLMSNVR